MPWLIAGYIWLYLHRPFEIWPVLGTFRLEFFSRIRLAQANDPYDLCLATGKRGYSQAGSRRWWRGHCRFRTRRRGP